MRKSFVVLAAVVTLLISGCTERADKAEGESNTGAKGGPASASAAAGETRKSKYTPPTAEELAPLRPEYSAELAKITEPPEMALKPMQVRKPASPAIVQVGDILNSLGSPEKATHSQRAETINALLKLSKDQALNEDWGKATLYSAVAMLSCIDGATPETVIGYANSAIGDKDDDALALRARMYLRASKPNSALDDLEKIMAHDQRNALRGEGTEPHKESSACGWSIADFDSLGSDPRALAAKGLYLSSFLSLGAQSRGAVNEAEIRNLYDRASKSWHSPIPHYLVSSSYTLGSEHSMKGAGCIRSSPVPEIVSVCEKYDDGMRQQIREMTMALMIEPTFLPALAARANLYLTLAQGTAADDKPSRKLFEFAIKDFDAALAVGAGDKHVLYCDRALAQASIGLLKDATRGYEQCMKYAKNGVEDSPFVYMQLAGLYLKIGRFNDAANLLSQALMNVSGGGMDVVIFSGGIRGFRALYPEYDLLPDEILAEAVRRRYFPQFSKDWNAEFISGTKHNQGKILSSVLSDLYALRGDAYLKAGRLGQAQADYSRLKSNAWGGDDRYLPRSLYFDESGYRNIGNPEPFPPLPAQF
ncbi:hypothetical protein [Rugamonas apoptosis]|uniref:Tetratricopeptide repeat protein n=1 Tax=Rugamonas apoptosis TaxID=2758570 RepID=A0A7W2F7B4_9BURK|nr:hypothetical protein [Rugamonas apoptosis]MBA5686339.1 hypothetical protein [Rugamonas apoptosis]